MQRRTFLIKAGGSAIAGSALAAAPVVAQTNPKIEWKLASSYTTAIPALFLASQRVCEKVAKATGGQFTIRLYPAGHIVPSGSVLDAVSNRTVECGHTAAYFYYGMNLAFCFDTNVPFGLNVRQMFAWMTYGDGMALMREVFAPHHVVNFPLGNTGAQMGGWYRKEINTLDDLKGLRMRIPGFGGEIMSRMGVIPQQIPVTDLYAALEKGVLDAVELVGPLDDERQGFHKVAPYYYYPGWWDGSAQVSLFANDAAFDALPEEYQTVLEMACAQENQRTLAHYDAESAAALRRLIAEGAVLRLFSRDIMDEAFKITEAFYAELCAKNASFKKIHDNYMAFRNETTAWLRLADGAYDNYMGIALSNRR